MFTREEREARRRERDAKKGRGGQASLSRIEYPISLASRGCGEIRSKSLISHRIPGISKFPQEWTLGEI